MRTFFAPLFAICLALTACGESVSPAPASPSNATSATTEPAASAPKAQPGLLRLKATVKDEPFKGAPACMVTFTIENLHDKPLAVFSAEFKPTQKSNGKALTTATEFAGLKAEVANLPLAPGATGNPWKQNVLGTSCDDIEVRFEGEFMCAFQGQPCKPAEVEAQQQGLHSVSGLGS